MKAANKVALLVPEVGTASDQVALASGGGEAATDDLYMEGISIRRGFASEFIALLEVRAVGAAAIAASLIAAATDREPCTDCRILPYHPNQFRLFFTGMLRYVNPTRRQCRQ